MSRSLRISCGIMAVLLVLISLPHLGALLFAALVGYFALQQFSFGHYVRVETSRRQFNEPAVQPAEPAEPLLSSRL